MAKLKKPFRCDILTPAGAVESAEVLSAVFPASDGMVGVLGGRAPLAAHVGTGRLSFQETSGRQREFFIAGGFAQMSDDVLTILAEECTPLEQLDPDATWTEIEEARQMPAETDAQIAERDQALDLARLKFRLVQQRRQPPPGQMEE